MINKLPTVFIVFLNIVITTSIIWFFDDIFPYDIIDSISQALAVSVCLILFFGNVISPSSSEDVTKRKLAISRFEYSLLTLGVVFLCYLASLA